MAPPNLRLGVRLGVLASCAVILANAGAARADALADLEAPFREAIASGNWTSMLAIAFLAGLATSLTPCVYPMIVITVGVFGARKSASRIEAAKLSTAFVLGIAALFTPLGVAAGLGGGVFGSQLSSPVVLVGIALVFLALAGSMFGAFELDLPAGLKNRLAGVGGAGLKGAFLLGLVSALIAAPCTGPVVGMLLTWVGTSGNVTLGAASFFVYALGLGLLFWLVGTFSMTLPKSGAWLEAVKSVFGVVMIAAAVYFVRDLVPGLVDVARRTPAFLASAVALTAAGALLGAVHLSFHDPRPLLRVRKGVGIALATTGLLGVVGYVQAVPPGAHIEWIDDHEAGRALARAGAKPMLIDFTASWCGACGELERHTFSDPRVVREAGRFVTVRVDLSPGKDTPERQAVLQGYAQRGLPFVVLHETTGQESARVTGFVTADEFLALMRKAH